MKLRLTWMSIIVLAALLLAAVPLTGSAGPAAAQSGDDPRGLPVEFLSVQIVDVRERIDTKYTQGLLFFDGSLFESTGLTGESTLRELDPVTGEVLRSVDVDESVFAEGLERVGDRLIQLTWKSEQAFVYDLETFEVVDVLDYTGQGWGLCGDGRYLYMSDGTAFLDVRDPETFELVFSGLVTLQGRPIDNFSAPNGNPLSRLNELECVGDFVYANVWKTDYILRIDKYTGVVTGVVNAEGLLSEEDRAALVDPSQDVLNGIVYLPESDTFLITGKRWPKMFEVRFVPMAPEDSGDAE